MRLKKYFRYVLLTVIVGVTTFLTLFFGIDLAEQTKDPDTSGGMVILTCLVLAFITFCLGLKTFLTWIENEN